jgi:hypothetical protein
MKRHTLAYKSRPRDYLARYADTMMDAVQLRPDASHGDALAYFVLARKAVPVLAVWLCEYRGDDPTNVLWFQVFPEDHTGETRAVADGSAAQ